MIGCMSIHYEGKSVAVRSGFESLFAVPNNPPGFRV